MVVVIGRVRALEARDPVSEVDALHELRLDEALDRAVHARDPDASAFTANALVDLLHGEAAVLAGEKIDDGAPCAAAAAARGAETLERALGPALHRR